MNLRPRARPLLFFAAVLGAACLPGARAPNVPPQRSLELRGADVSGNVSNRPFQVVFAGPKGDTVDPTEVTIVFNRPMRPLDLAGEEASPPARIDPQPKGQWRWLGTSALAFIPAKALPRATPYKVTVPKGTKALEGSTLAEDYTFEFNTPGPRLVHVTPGEGSTHLTPKQTFELRFNQPVDPKEVEKATTLTANGKPLAFGIERPKADVPMLVKLTPKAPLPLASKIEIAVGATLKGLEGPLPAGVSKETHVETYGPMEVKETSCSRTERTLCAPHGGVFVSLSNRVKLKDFRAHVRVEPALKLAWPKGRDDDDKVEWQSLPLDLPPAATVRVTITAGLKDEYGQVLAKDHVATFTTDDEFPSVVIGLQGDVLEAAKAKGRDVPIASVNVRSYELVSAALDEAGLMKLRTSRRTADDRFAALREAPGAKFEDVKPGGPRNLNSIKNVSIDGVLSPSKGRGVLAIAVSRPNPRSAGRPIRDITTVTVTDLAITARLSRFGSVVMVTRLSDGKPVSGATVAARKGEGKELFSQKTDANGMVSIGADKLQPVTVDGGLDDGLVLFARSGDDWTYRSAVDTVSRADVPYVDLAARMHTFGMLITDRGIYKAGETIRVKGVFRKPVPRGMETPAGRNVTLRVYDPDGGKMFEHQAKLGAFGEISADVPIPTTSRLGTLNIEAIADDEHDKESYSHAAYTSVSVAAYRPAEFKTSVEPDKTSYVRGDKASFTARGDYLFGAPMTGGKVRYTVTRSRAFFSPPNTEKLVTDDESYSSALPDSTPRGGTLQRGDGVLDAKGTYAAAVALALPKQTGAENVTMEAEIEDLSRQTVASQTTALVHPAEFYLGLERPKEMFPQVGTPLRANVSAVDPRGLRRASVPVQVELVERTWKTATEAVGEEDLHYESRPVDKVVAQCTATTAANDGAGCELTPPGAGFYIVRAKSKDGRGNPIAASYSVYVVGEGARMAWPVYDGAKLELVTDKKSYEVGDTATILIKSPFTEADALVTVERQGVYEQRRISVKGPMPTIKVPVTNDLWPNAYVGVQLIKARTAPIGTDKAKGHDVGAPSFRLGYAEIAVNPEGRRLDVKVKPSKKDLRPGEEVEVELAVTGRDGKGAKADVAFYAVDEGVLMLTGYKTPDPLPVFAQHRALSVAPIESRDDLARIVRLGRAPGVDKGDEGGGGDDGGMSTREDFRTTAFFQPSVVTGADGKAKVKFKLPDSLTTFRLMAVATAQDHRFGFGQDQVVTSRPLMARPALPRFLRAGDAIEAGVIVTSKGLPAQKVDVKISAAGVQIASDASKTVDLPANGSIEVRWPILAPAAGGASFTFTAKASGGADQVTVPREVKVPLSLEAVALYGDTEKAVAEKLGNMASMRSDTGGLDLRVASTALVGLDDGVESLLDYPYGCTEQLTSRLVPLVALVDLAKDYGIKLPSSSDRVADEAIAKILKSQRSDGSFGYWPDSQEADVWVTTYAVWALSIAKEHGRPVPAPALENAVKWLRDQIAACAKPHASPRWHCGDGGVVYSQHAFILDVLASTGQADAGFTARVFENRAKMPLFARALLAHAMVVSKMRIEDAKELVADTENHLRVTPAGATVVENLGDSYAPLLDSEARTTAIVLRTLVAIDPNHPLAARLAKGLLAARRGGSWRSTQENAWALIALDSYRRAQEAKAPDFDAEVFFGEKLLFSAPFHGRSVKTQSATIPAAEMVGKGGEPLAFQVHGTGRLFYEARLRYAKKELPTAPLDRGFFVRKLVRSLKPEALADAMRVLPQSSMTNANASDLVLVDLLVVTPDPREQVVIDDPLPAGLEPVQSALATTARDLAVTDPGGMGDAGDDDDARDVDARASGATFNHSWYHRELHDDRVLTFVDHMAAGMYHYRYLARATTPGKFVVPPTKAECMYEPETFGRTAAGTFEVKK